MDSFAESFSKQASGAEAFRIKHRRGPPAGDGPAPPSAQDLPGLFATLECFQDLFRPLSEHWLKRFEYYEAWPQLLLQAYLQRVVNSGGRIEREYGLGRGRTDPPGRVAAGGKRTSVRDRVRDLADGLRSTLRKGSAQTAGYMDRCAAQEGHLVLFARTRRRWKDKVFRLSEAVAGRVIEVWGM